MVNSQSTSWNLPRQYQFYELYLSKAVFLKIVDHMYNCVVLTITHIKQKLKAIEAFFLLKCQLQSDYYIKALFCTRFIWFKMTSVAVTPWCFLPQCVCCPFVFTILLQITFKGKKTNYCEPKLSINYAASDLVEQKTVSLKKIFLELIFLQYGRFHYSK